MRRFRGGAVSAIREKIYPVGSLYLSVVQTSPASFLGGTWEPLTEGCTLWTTTTANTGGNAISAGLPNIYGTLGDTDNGVIGGSGQNKAIGAYGGFASLRLAQVGGFGNGNGYSQRYSLLFNAQNYNSIYGNSTTVQPPAIKVYAWQRTA